MVDVSQVSTGVLVCLGDAGEEEVKSDAIEEAQVLRQRCEDVVWSSWLGVSHFDKERP